MPNYYHLNTDEQVDNFIKEVSMRRLGGNRVRVIFENEPPKQRTQTQNRCLHGFLAELAECLNDAGFDMVAVLNDGVSIPWTPESAKEHLWKPIQKAMLDKESTTDADTTDYNKVYEVLTRHLGSKLGIQCPEWPTRFSQ